LPDRRLFLERLWLGTGQTGISKAQPQAVAQGYAPCIPVNVKEVSL
jgi:hypothetical protein